MKTNQHLKNKNAFLAHKPLMGSEVVIRSLIEEGVDLVFGYPGGAIMPIYDSLHQFSDKLKHILTRHEQGATHAAQGFARVTGKTGVVFATSGPGATNLVTGLADALIDSTPIVCIVGQVPSNLLGTDAFQETDVIGISTPVTKWNKQITKASEIAPSIAKAFYIAKLGRPGPVLLDITKDAQFESTIYHYRKCKGIRSYDPVPSPSDEAVKKAANLINNAKKPYFFFGQGVLLSNAGDELRMTIEKTGAPCAWTILGLSALPSDHPQNMGMLGMHGNYACNILTSKADVVVAIGMRFDDRVTGRLDKYLPKAKVIHIEIDPAEVGKNVDVEVPLIGDAKEILTRLLPYLIKKERNQWLNQFRNLHKAEVQQVINNDFNPKGKEIGMAEVINSINSYTNGDSIIVTDVGQHQMVACRYVKFSKFRSNITSGGLGTMGFALPAAIGAKIGCPNREVIAIIGDGGFQMTIQELGTIFQYKVGVKILILNNNFLGMVRQWQELFFEKRYASTEMVNPDFVKIAIGYGIPALKLKKREKLDDAISLFINEKGPFLLEVKVQKEENVFPMVPSGASVSEIRLS